MLKLTLGSRYISCLILCFCFLKLDAIVLYDQGRIEINGVQLFQDSKNENEYYYLPPYPRISISDKDDFEFLCIKYVGEKNAESGGLFHALIQFSLTAEKLEETKALLKKEYPKAIIRGPLNIQEYKDSTDPSFKVVSSILNSESPDYLTSQLISSGRAPFLPGSKAAISSLLNTKAATLLWSTFESTTSDVSVVVEGYFPALVKGFTASVSADLEMVYEHFSKFSNNQSGFSKEELTEVIDSLSQTGNIQIEVADMSDVTGVNTDLYQNLLDIVTNKVTNMMFDTREGWSKMPTMESPVKPQDLKGRYKRGAISSFVFGEGMQPYIPDNQLLLKEKKLIRNFVFNMQIDQSTAIKVPVYSAGNIGGFYEEYSSNDNYFKIVDMDDIAFQSRDVHFQVNSTHLDCFNNGFDNATILFEKSYADTSHYSHNKSIHFNASRIDSGELIQKCNYNRLGEESDEWLNYKYKVSWNLDDMDTTLVSDWISSDRSSISIQPPLVRKTIIVDLDRSLMDELNIQSARLRFGIKLAGKAKMTKMKVLRKADALSTDEIIIYHDPDEPIVYQINWYTRGKEIKQDVTVLEDDYLFLIPPSTEKE